jgi:hypothetical protein
LLGTTLVCWLLVCKGKLREVTYRCYYSVDENRTLY